LLLAIEAALRLNARVPMVLRVDEITGYTDWVLLLSGRSERNVRAIVDAIEESLAKTGLQPMGADGRESGQWSLLDYDDFMIHVFYHPVRQHYDLESMWSDAPRVNLELPAEVFDESELSGLQMPDDLPEFRGDASNFGGFADEFNSFDPNAWGDDDDGDDAFADDEEFVSDDEDDDDALLDELGDDDEDDDAAETDDDSGDDDGDATDSEDDRGSAPEDGWGESDEIEISPAPVTVAFNESNEEAGSTNAKLEKALRKKAAKRAAKGPKKEPARTAEEDADLFEDSSE
jgi:ribosome-associated protein